MPKKLRLEIPVGSLPKSHAGKEGTKISIEVDLPTKVFTVGRLSYNDIVLTFQTISLIHARVYVVGRLLFLEDLDSLNGTYHESFEVGRNQMTLIQSGDQVQMADIPMRIFLDLLPPQKDADSTEKMARPLTEEEFFVSDPLLATELETLPCRVRESISKLLSGSPKAFTDSFSGQTPEPPLPLVKAQPQKKLSMEAQPQKKSLQNCPGLIPMKPKEKFVVQRYAAAFYGGQTPLESLFEKKPSFLPAEPTFDEHAVTVKRSLPPLASLSDRSAAFEPHPSLLVCGQVEFAGEIRRYFPWQDVDTPSLPSALLPQTPPPLPEEEALSCEASFEKKPKK